MSKNLFNTQSGAADQQMVQVSLMGLHGDGPQLTQFFFFFLLDCSFSIYSLLKLSLPCSVLQPARASGPHDRRLWPHAMQTHMRACWARYVHAQHETTDSDAAGRGQMWQSRDVLPSEHDFGRQGGAATHSTGTRVRPGSVAKVSSHQLMTQTGLPPGCSMSGNITRSSPAQEESCHSGFPPSLLRVAPCCPALTGETDSHWAPIAGSSGLLRPDCLPSAPAYMRAAVLWEGGSCMI